MKKVFLCLAVIGVVVALTTSAMAATTLRELGRSPFYKPPLTTVDDLYKLVDESQAAIQQGFAKAGMAGLYPAFTEQFPTADIETTQVKPGTKLDWMLFRKNGKGSVRVAKDVTWAGEEPFDAFRFYLDSAGKRYEMVVPWGCGNLALAGVGDVPAPPPPAPPPPPPPPKPEVKPEVPPPVEEVVPEAKRRLWPVATLGFMRLHDPANFLPVRVGVEYALADNVTLLGLLGYNIHLEGTNGDDALSVDALIHYHISRFFVGGGLGYWYMDDDSTMQEYLDGSHLDLILQLGVRVFGEPDAFNVALYGEGRAFADELSDADINGRWGAGLLFRF
jgi:hypothetical protein